MAIGVKRPCSALPCMERCDALRRRVLWIQTPERQHSYIKLSSARRCLLPRCLLPLCLLVRSLATSMMLVQSVLALGLWSILAAAAPSERRVGRAHKKRDVNTDITWQPRTFLGVSYIFNKTGLLKLIVHRRRSSQMCRGSKQGSIMGSGSSRPCRTLSLLMGRVRRFVS